ncbi:transcription factor bHLH90 [Euphorbia lathyris]|uniref:transcription factor bHLH90 n=1 Tax=Euphorbia lathyris TaxID=212925 RepID=UPI0033144D2A
MKALERALELLRPLIDSKNWDYCVVWKLGDDPSRFIEWMGCCCCGGGGKVEKQSRVENESFPLCRDLYFRHKIRTKACEALARFPSFIPLYSEGIHGEVVTSNQSKWLAHSISPDSNSYNESVGTRVLIPVLGGLIELFAAKHIPKDQKIIDFITAHCNVLKQEGMVEHCYSSLNEFGLDPFLEENLHILPAQSHLVSLIPRTDIVRPLNQSNPNSSLEGTSCCLDSSNDHPSLHSRSGYFSQNGVLKHSIEKPSGLRKSESNDNSLRHQGDQVPDCKNKVSKASNKSEFRSKNLVTERKRRSRINDGIFTLRSLVPKITKMNKVATLGDAINYILELEDEVKNLKDELKEIEEGEEEEEFRKRNKELTTSRLETSLEDKKHLPSNEINHNSDSSCEKKKIEEQTEVNQIGKREFLIRVLSEQKKGGFGRLIDLIHSLGLQVVNVNMTTCNCQVQTVLTVEAISKDIQPKRLRESLLKLGG